MLRILHTADWHLGQTFYEYDRSYEHLSFLNWLADTIQKNEIDVLLICGDIFDVSNPSAASTRMFYDFLKALYGARKNLQVVCIAGNHDSAARLEAPAALLEVFNVSVSGQVEWTDDKTPDYRKLTIPLYNKNGEAEGLCLAVPFLRPGDYPHTNGYAKGVETFYEHGIEFLKTIRQPRQAIIALGHLHTLDAATSSDDKSERTIMGGLEFVPVSAFSEEVSYTALGHIHRAQVVGGRSNVRYAGSPLPMSFSEVKYQHQIVMVELNGNELISVQPLEVPVSASLISVPDHPKPLAAVVEALTALPVTGGSSETYPYLQVRVLLEGPEPSLRHQIETALNGKAVRLARIEVTYPQSRHSGNGSSLTTDDLQKLQPVEMFQRKYLSRYNSNVPEELIALFNGVISELEQAGTGE
jgi:exonuclease SbcD